MSEIISTILFLLALLFLFASVVALVQPKKISQETTRAGGFFSGMIITFLLLISSFAFSGKNSSQEAKQTPQKAETTPPQQKQEKACEKTDLNCLANDFVIAAGVLCRRDIERLSPHELKWTDGVFETKFSRVKWTTTPGNGFTAIGDKAMMGLASGAFVNVIYECDMTQDGETVIAVRSRPGRL